jgi:hypothetical protein
MTYLDDPFSGNWTLNCQESNFDPNHRPRLATMRWERTVDGYQMRAEGEKDDGRTVVDQATFVLDGQEHPIPTAPGFTASAERPDPNTIRSVGKRDGNVVGEGVYTVSPDGSTLTATVRGIDAQNRPFQTIVVFDREQIRSEPG